MVSRGSNESNRENLNKPLWSRWGVTTKSDFAMVVLRLLVTTHWHLVNTIGTCVVTVEKNLGKEKNFLLSFYMLQG